MIFTISTIFMITAILYAFSKNFETVINKLFFYLFRLLELPLYFIAYSAMPFLLMITLIYFGHNFSGMNLMVALVIIGSFLLTVNKYIKLNHERGGKWFSKGKNEK